MFTTKAHSQYGTRADVIFVVAVVAFVLFSPALSVHGQGDNEFDVGFGGATISDKTYTAGADVNQMYSSAGDQDLPALPRVTVKVPDDGIFNLDVTYSATGLPAGLYLDHNRVIRGIPEEATRGAVTVTYTADAVIDEYHLNTQRQNEVYAEEVSLTFEVTVNPAVTFDEAALTFLNSKIVTWIQGQGWLDAGADGTITFPEASGGTGTITYRLIANKSQQPLADVADGITFNATTRKLGGTPSQEARRDWAVRYWAEDENGSRASRSLTIHADGWGGL